MLDIFLDSLFDSLKMLPWIFLTYVVIEILERKVTFARSGKFLEGRAAPLFGSLAGAFPQCGVSVMSAKLYDRGLIRVGTVLAVFIATSDEAFSVLLASDKRLALIPLIAIKILLGVAVGFAANALVTGRIIYNSGDTFSHEEVCAHCHDHVHEEGRYSWISKYILVPILHSLQTFLYVFIVTFAFGIVFGEGGLVGEENFENFLSSSRYFAPFIASLVGLIPNCASSAVISSAYVNGVISFGALFAGLTTNAGVGLAVLFKNTAKTKRNLAILLTMYLVGAVTGVVISLVTAALDYRI